MNSTNKERKNEATKAWGNSIDRVKGKRLNGDQSTRKKPWSKDEDENLMDLINSSIQTDKGYQWTKIAAVMGDRSGKQCRERWHNHLKTDLRKGEWTEAEDILIIKLQSEMGNQWSKITQSLPGRSDNSVKNRWYSLTRSNKKRTIDIYRSDLETDSKKMEQTENRPKKVESVNARSYAECHPKKKGSKENDSITVSMQTDNLKQCPKTPQNKHESRDVKDEHFPLMPSIRKHLDKCDDTSTENERKRQKKQAFNLKQVASGFKHPGLILPNLSGDGASFAQHEQECSAAQSEGFQTSKLDNNSALEIDDQEAEEEYSSEKTTSTVFFSVQDLQSNCQEVPLLLEDPFDCNNPKQSDDFSSMDIDTPSPKRHKNPSFSTISYVFNDVLSPSPPTLSDWFKRMESGPILGVDANNKFEILSPAPVRLSV